MHIDYHSQQNYNMENVNIDCIDRQSDDSSSRSKSRLNYSLIETNSLIDELNDSHQSIPTVTQTKEEDDSIDNINITAIEPIQTTQATQTTLLKISREAKRK